jgi:hypothetical protein
LYVALRIGLGLGTVCHFAGTSHESSAALGTALSTALGTALGVAAGFGPSGGTPEALDPGGSLDLEHPSAKRTTTHARSFIASK